MQTHLNSIHTVANNTTKQFNCELGLLRIIATLMVLVIHAMDIYINSSDTLTKYMAIIVKSFVVFAVPIFIMISGYLLAQRDSKIKYTYIKQFTLVILLPMFYYNAIYYIRRFVGFTYFNYEEMKLIEFIKPMIGEVSQGFLWYFPAIIPVYLVFLFVKIRVPKEHFDYLLGGGMLAILVIGQILSEPPISLIPPIPWNLSWSMLYALAGVYVITPLVQYREKLQKYNLLFVSLYILIVCFIAYQAIENNRWYPLSSAVMYSVTICFVSFILTLPTQKIKDSLKEYIYIYSQMTLSFFGLHVIALFWALNLVNTYATQSPVSIQMFLVLFITIVLSIILTIIEQFIIHKIGSPLIRKIKKNTKSKLTR